MDFKHVRPCKTTAAVEIIPVGKLSMELEKSIEKFEISGAGIVADAGIMLVLELPEESPSGELLEGVEVSIFTNGKMVVKTREIEKARRAGKFVYDVMGV